MQIFQTGVSIVPWTQDLILKILMINRLSLKTKKNTNTASSHRRAVLTTLWRVTCLHKRPHYLRYTYSVGKHLSMRQKPTNFSLNCSNRVSACTKICRSRNGFAYKYAIFDEDSKSTTYNSYLWDYMAFDTMLDRTEKKNTFDILTYQRELLTRIETAPELVLAMRDILQEGYYPSQDWQQFYDPKDLPDELELLTRENIEQLIIRDCLAAVTHCGLILEMLLKNFKVIETLS